MAGDDELVSDIVTHAEEAMGYLDGVSLDQYRSERRLQLQIERLLEIVGEAAGNLSPEFRDGVDFDWRAVRGLRNILSHQYGFVDHERLWRTVKERLPLLVAELGD